MPVCCGLAPAACRHDLTCVCSTRLPPPLPLLFVAAAHQNAVVVKSPKSGVNFFNLGDYEEQFEAARQRALPVLRQLLEEDRLAGSSASGKNSGKRSGSSRASSSGASITGSSSNSGSGKNIGLRGKLLQGKGGAATAASS